MKFNFATLLFVAVGGLFFTACNKASVVGADILPATDQLNLSVTDTLTVRSLTVAPDSVLMYAPGKQPFSRFLIGSYYDPIFGYEKSSIYAQLRLLATSPTFTNQIADSLVFRLAYDRDSTKTAGDISRPQTISIYRLLRDPIDSLNIDGTFYSGKSFTHSTTPLVTATFTPNLRPRSTSSYLPPFSKDESINGDTTQRFLRITMKGSNLALANELLANPASHVSTTDFLNLFKGIYIDPDQYNNAMIRFNLYQENGSGSRMTLYYHDKDSVKQTNSFSYYFSNSSARILHHSQIQSNTIRSALAANKQTAIGDSVMYIQGLSGVNGRIEIPYAKAFQNALINKAELTLTAINEVTDTNTVRYPTTILTYKRLSDGTLGLTKDAAVAVTKDGYLSRIYGGFLQKQSVTPIVGPTTNYNIYVINITGQLQDMAAGRTVDNYIYLTAYDREESPSRVVLGGVKNSKYRIKLKVYYTKTGK